MRLIELHILQSFPVTCLNRDDVGSPKSAQFGGVSRARVSSQCWKRAIRLLANAQMPEAYDGKRTWYITEIFATAFEAVGVKEPHGKAEMMAAYLANGKRKPKKEEKTDGATYYTPTQVQLIAQAVASEELKLSVAKGKVDIKTKSKSLMEILNDSYDLTDIAIFGRMVANDSSLTLEGAGMFSHALSTHQVANEVDFFSAVDDLKPEDTSDAGAGHIGTLEFNSACYYRYIGVNWDLLYKDKLGKHGHLSHFTDEHIRSVVGAFLQAVILAVPNARHNSMFGNTPPDHILGLVRTGQPLSLINAFEKPIRPKNGYVEPSNEAMTNQFKKLKKTYDGLGIDVEERMPEKSLQEFIAALLASSLLA